MRIFTFLLIILLGFVIISCEKEYFSDESLNGSLLLKVLIDDEVNTEYTYNNSGLINEEKNKFHYSRHNYNNKNQLIQSDFYWDERIASSSSNILEEAMKRTDWVNPENTQKDSYFQFEYTKSGKLVKRMINRLNSDIQSYDILTWGEQDRIKRRTWYYENKESGFDNYFYDYNGNLIKQERYFVLESGEHKLQTTTEFEFDHFHNPYYTFRGLMIPGQNTNPNNIIKETYTLHFDVDGFIEPIQIKEYRYEYNQLGYPVKRDDSYVYVYN